MSEDSSPVASVIRALPDYTFAISASSDDLHGPRQHHAPPQLLVMASQIVTLAVTEP